MGGRAHRSFLRRARWRAVMWTALTGRTHGCTRGRTYHIGKVRDRAHHLVARSSLGLSAHHRPRTGSAGVGSAGCSYVGGFGSLPVTLATVMPRYSTPSIVASIPEQPAFSIFQSEPAPPKLSGTLRVSALSRRALACARAFARPRRTSP